MARKGPSKPRKIFPDPVYKNEMLSRLINRSMLDGKKSVAARNVYQAMEKIKAETKQNPVEIFELALENIRPTMEVRPRRVGGAAYQVPMPVRGPRKESLAIRWLIFAARSRSNSEFKTFGDKLAAEIIDASKGEGGAVTKRAEMERIAEANRAFSHFRW